MPKISVLLPTYGYARFLPEAIESVLAQDFTDFELLISDDASPDGSGEVIRRYGALDPRIRCQIHEKNLGMVANWNWCLREARGEYVKYLFGDDRLNSPQALGRMAAMLDAEPRAVLAATGRLIIDDDSKPVDAWKRLGEAGLKDGAQVIAQCFIHDGNLIGEPTAVMFRRAASVRGFEPSWRQLVDEEMWFHLLTAGDLVYDPALLCAFRVHAAQQTAVNRESGVSSAESLMLLARYLDHFAGGVGRDIRCLRVRRMLFNHIYYSHKNACRDARQTPALSAAEADLMARLTRRWYVACLLMHRLQKPLVNLARWLLRACGRPMPDTTQAEFCRRRLERPARPT